MNKRVLTSVILVAVYITTTIGAIIATKWGVTRMYPEMMRPTVGWSSSIATILAAQVNVILLISIWSYLRKK